MFAEEENFGERVAHGPITFVLATGFVYRTGILEPTVLAFLGMNYADIPNPVYVDDTVSPDVEVVETKGISSRDDSGMVVIDTTMTNGEDTVAFDGDTKFLIKKEATDE